MAYTLDQVTALEKALAQGITRVKYADREVYYNSRGQMKAQLLEMKRELGLIPKRSRLKVYTCKGV